MARVFDEMTKREWSKVAWLRYRTRVLQRLLKNDKTMLTYEAMALATAAADEKYGAMVEQEEKRLQRIPKRRYRSPSLSKRRKSK